MMVTQIIYNLFNHAVQTKEKRFKKDRKKKNKNSKLTKFEDSLEQAYADKS